jgi:hypothetical protein
MGSKITVWVFSLVLYFVLPLASIGDQPPGVALNPNGLSKIIWMFNSNAKDDRYV